MLSTYRMSQRDPCTCCSPAPAILTITNQAPPSTSGHTPRALNSSSTPQPPYPGRGPAHPPRQRLRVRGSHPNIERIPPTTTGPVIHRPSCEGETSPGNPTRSTPRPTTCRWPAVTPPQRAFLLPATPPPPRAGTTPSLALGAHPTPSRQALFSSRRTLSSPDSHFSSLPRAPSTPPPPPDGPRVLLYLRTKRVLPSPPTLRTQPISSYPVYKLHPQGSLRSFKPNMQPHLLRAQALAEHPSPPTPRRASLPWAPCASPHCTTSSEPRAWPRTPQAPKATSLRPDTPLPGGDRRGCRLPQPSVEVPRLGPRSGARQGPRPRPGLAPGRILAWGRGGPGGSGGGAFT